MKAWLLFISLPCFASSIALTNVVEHGTYFSDLNPQVIDGSILLHMDYTPMYAQGDMTGPHSIESDFSADFNLDGYTVTGAFLSGMAWDDGVYAGENAYANIDGCYKWFSDANTGVRNCNVSGSSGHIMLSAEVHTDQIYPGWISDSAEVAGVAITISVIPAPEPSFGLIFLFLLLWYVERPIREFCRNRA